MTGDGRSGPRILGSIVVGLATVLACVGLAIALFFNPVWVGFEQDRTNAAAWTGYTPDQVHVVTNDILREVYLGPGTFAQTVNGAPVFAERERSHMADVRRVVVVFFGAALLAALFLLVSGLFSRGGAWWWRAVSRGAALLAIGGGIVGVAFMFFFEQAFTIFHEIFFAAGTWTFDPATDRLVQLFPDAFWTETSVAIAIVGVVLTSTIWALARRLADRAEWKASMVPMAPATPVGPGTRAR